MSRLSAVVSAVATGAVASAALFTGLAFASSTAVTFDGSSLLGLPLLSCASKPDVDSVSLETGDTLQVRNMTGHSAVIYVNGSKATTNADLGAGSAAPMTFPAGTWTVALVPACVLNLNDAGAVTVQVTAPPARVAPPAPPVKVAPTATATATHVASPPTQIPSAAPEPVAPPLPTPSTPGAGSATTPVPTTPPAHDAHPTRVPTPVGAVGAGTGVGGTDVGGTTADGTAPDPTGVTPDGTPTGDGVASGGTSTDAGVEPSRIAIGPSVALPTGDTQGPNYLLVLFTTISIIGVGVAAIRALVTRRSVRRAY